MQQHDLHPTPGSTSSRKRRGRGHGSGLVKTSGRGQKGQKARTGHSKMPVWFEGSPSKTNSFKRSPYKRGVGFNNPNHIEWVEVNLERLGDWPSDQITPETLLEQGLIKNLKKPVKLLGIGEVGRAFSVRVHRVSAGTRQKIEAAGGTVEELLQRKTKRAGLVAATATTGTAEATAQA